MNPEQFARALSECGINLSRSQMKQFATYWETLVHWNKKMNLTNLTDQTDVYLKHFYDSITIAFYKDVSGPLNLCDVGAGAGFPSLPLKICFPQLKVTIVDSLQKRVGFLNHLAQELNLTDVAIHHDRAENFGRNKIFREKFDIVTARAVARMSVLSELCLPLIKPQGSFLAMKGSQGLTELEEAQHAIEQLGGVEEDLHTFQLPGEESERTLIVIHKKRQTANKYPRKAGTAKKNPL